MTQENKMERIKTLVKELTEECNNQDVVLTLQATSKDNNFSGSAFCGSIKDVGLNLLLLEESIKEETGKSIKAIKLAGAATVCDCPKCTAKREEKKTNVEKIPKDVLAKFLDELFNIAARGGDSND